VPENEYCVFIISQWMFYREQSFVLLANFFVFIVITAAYFLHSEFIKIYWLRT